MSELRVLLTTESLPPRYAIRSATIPTPAPQPRMHGMPPSATELAEAGKPLYLRAFLTPEARAEYIAREGLVVVEKFIGEAT